MIGLLIVFAFVILYINYLKNGEIILLTLNMPYVWILPSLLLLFSIYKISDMIMIIYNSKLNKNIEISNPSKISKIIKISIPVIIIAFLLLANDRVIEEKLSENDVPFLTVKELEHNDNYTISGMDNWDILFGDDLTIHKSIFTNEWVEARERRMLPSNSIGNEDSYSYVFTWYYDFKFTSWAKKATSELVSKYMSADYVKVDSNILDDVYYKETEKDIIFRYEDKVGYIEFDGKQDVESLIATIEDWATKKGAAVNYNY